jgi:hypothetical protein
MHDCYNTSICSSLKQSDSGQSILEPALMKFEDKSYSLEPDIVNG